MELTDKQATDLLTALLSRKGTLKIVTSEVHPDHRTDKKDPRSAAKAGVNLQDPASMVLLDVVKIEPHEARTTHLVAYADDGSNVESYDGPQALLERLLEWRYFDATNPAATRYKVQAVIGAMQEALARPAE